MIILIIGAIYLLAYCLYYELLAESALFLIAIILALKE